MYLGRIMDSLSMTSMQLFSPISAQSRYCFYSGESWVGKDHLTYSGSKITVVFALCVLVVTTFCRQQYLK